MKKITFFLLLFINSIIFSEDSATLAPLSALLLPDLEQLTDILAEKGFTNLKQVTKSIEKYYNEVSRDKLIEKHRQIKEAFGIAENPYSIFSDVLGVGFPFYLDSNSLQQINIRIYLTLKKLLNQLESNEVEYSEYLEQTYILKLLPDLDILVIYNGNLLGIETPDMHKKILGPMLNNFMNRYMDMYQRVAMKLQKLNLHIGEPDFNSIAAPFLTDETIAPENIKLHLDILLIDSRVWENLPLFVTPEDTSDIYLVRDMLFTTERISDIPSQIVTEFRKNYLLNILNNNKPLTFQELLKIITTLHPYKELIENVPGIRSYTVNLWKEVYNKLQASDFTENINGKLTISQKGKSFIQEILNKRNALKKSTANSNRLFNLAA